MKSACCIIFMSLLALSLSAQNSFTDVFQKEKECLQDGYKSPAPAPFSKTHLYLKNQLPLSPAGARNVTTVPLGSAGNLFTILDGAVNRITADNELNTVVFIHRSDPSVFPTSNVGQFRYDVSYDGGNTWSLNHGVLNPTGNQQTAAGRYPNGAIYNPTGNTDPDSAYLVYIGSWLPFDVGGNWDGHFTGVARLDNDTTTFTENISTPNNMDISVVAGLSKGEPGEFWAVNWAFDDVQFFGILLFKGVWDENAKDVVWTLDTTMVPPFDLSFDNMSKATALNMAFDPTGQYGWIGFSGDIVAGGDFTFNPVFYQTTNGGDSWTGPIVVDLADMQNVVDNLAASNVPMTAFDMDIVVDANGNPHMLTVIGSSGQDYAISTGVTAGLKIYDITYFDNPAPCGGWQAILLDSIQTFRGQITPDVSEDNRPQASRSPDGTKVFFGWLDSDPNITQGTNDLPDLKTIGYDVNTGLATPVVNWTKTDPTWSGGALFASFAPTTLYSGNTYTVPVVFAELNASGLDTDPARFHYIQNIQYTNADFTNLIVPAGLGFPAITLTGPDTIFVYIGETFSDPGATAFDCEDGDITSSVQATGSVNVNTRDTVTISYNATDSEGKNAPTETRTVIVGTEPDPDFTWQQSGTNLSVTFTDNSLYDATNWSWNFGDQFTQNTQNEIISHIYTQPGSYNVCMTARNVFNAAPFNRPAKDTCKTITVSPVNGIAEAAIDQSFNIYPNPSSGIIYIDVKTNLFSEVVIRIHDMVGKELTYAKMEKLTAGTKQAIDLKEMSEGFYFVKIETADGSIAKKVLIANKN